MSKRKTVLKFAIAAVLLGGSSTVAVLYFPYAALAIKFGIVASTSPLAIFAISGMVALASAITLGVLVVSALRSNSKSNEVDEKLRSKNEEEGKSLVQEKEEAVPTPMPELLPQEPEELVTPAQQQPVGDSAKGTEMPQHEEEVNFVDNGDSAEQQAEQTKGSLPSLLPYQEQTSPMNNMRRSESFPNPPSGEHNSSRNASPSQQTMVKVLYNGTEDSLPPSPPIEPLNSFDQSQPFPSLPSIVAGSNGSGNSSREERVFYQDGTPSLSSSISSLYGSHYSISSDPLSSSGSTSSLSSTFSSITSGDRNALPAYPAMSSLHSGYSSLPSPPKMSQLLRDALSELEQQQNQTGSGVEQGYYNSGGGELNSMDAAHMSMIRGEFGSSYFSSIAPNSMTRSFIEQSQGECLPLITEEAESVSISLQEPRVNQVVPSYLPENAFQGIGADPNTINYSDQDYESFNYPALVPTYTSPRSAAQHDNGAAKSLPLNDSVPEGMLSGVHPVKSSDFKSI